MRYGFYLPTRGGPATREGLTAFLRKGEAAGFHSVMIGDHVVFPVENNSKYPYTVSGVLGHGDALEQLSLMSFVAGRTERLRIVSSVMILPHRNPILTAKMLASIDVLSGGRVTVGVGVGWLREEFEALHAPDFDARGAVGNEWIEIFRKLWTEDPAEHAGPHYSFEAVHCLPQPLQKPHPPIWIGGHSKAALRRVARYGDGWHPVGSVAAVPLPPSELRQKLDELRRLTDAEGRDFGRIEISYKAPIHDTGTPIPGAARTMFSGSGEQIAGDVEAFRAIGVDEIVFDFRASSLSESLERMDRIARDVMPLTRGLPLTVE